ncbi:gfo/Idh/MocA family oxidoreductase [Bacillus canaveralius]|nr:gfo/Idh/MocA family oxidoreductase [Bacillus canaveralius]
MVCNYNKYFKRVRKMNIGVIGIGDIARKAYIPLYAENRNHTFHFHTRKKETLELVRSKYGFSTHTSLSSLFQEKLDGVMIHAATSAHEQLIFSCLEQGIPVFVDKPVTDSFSSTQRLVKIAEEKKIPLMVGFNRRFVPLYQQANSTTEANMILLQKNRYHLPGEVKNFVYDDFIHVVDTLLYFLNSAPDKWEVKGQWAGSQLSSIMLSVSKGNQLAVGIMNRDAGVNEEVLEVMSPTKKTIVRNLSEYVVHEQRNETRTRTNDWQTMLNTRGFEAMLKTFFDHLENDTPLPLSLNDVLVTHEWCEMIVDRLMEDHKI